VADSVVTLGLDLSAFDAVLREGMDGLSKGAQRALAGAKKAAAEATREAASALKVQLRLQSQAAADNAAALRQQVAAERALAAEAQKRADIQARAAKALAGMAAGRTETERLTHAYREQIAEIQRLVEVTGDQAAGAKAVAAATAQHQAAMAALKPAADDAAGAVKGAAGASWQMQQQSMSLRKNLGDFANSLLAGQSPFTVLMQQGPQVAEIFAETEDVVELLQNSFGNLIGKAKAAGGAIAIAAVAVAAAAAAYTAAANAADENVDGNNRLMASFRKLTEAADTSTAAINAQRTAMANLRAGADELRQQVLVDVGALDQYEAAATAAKKALADKTREDLMAVTAIKAKLVGDLAVADAAWRASEAGSEERKQAAALTRQIREQIEVESKKIEIARADYDSQLDLIDSIKLAAQERARQAKADEAATEALQKLNKETSESERRQTKIAALLKDAREEVEKQAKAARAWDMAMGEVNATAQELARVIPDLEAVIAQIEAAGAAGQAKLFKELDDSVAAYGDTIRDMVLAPLRDAYSQAKALGGTLQEAAGVDLRQMASAQGLVTLAADAVTAEKDALATVAEARASLRDAVASGDAGAIAEARAALQGARAELEQARPYAFVTGLVDGAADMVEAIVEALPAVVDGLVDSAPRLIDGIVSAIPQLVIALAKAAPQIAIDLATAFAVELPIQLLANLPAIAKSLAVGIGEGFVEAGARIKRVIGDIFREIATGGRADTRTFGDTPGPQRVGPGGARVSAGDYVVAARSREGLAAQMGGQPSPQAVVVTLDVRDGPVSLGLSRAVARDLSRRGAGRDSSGRRSPYGGGGW
jgi:hypothetical protein